MKTRINCTPDPIRLTKCLYTRLGACTARVDYRDRVRVGTGIRFGLGLVIGLIMTTFILHNNMVIVRFSLSIRKL